MTSTELRLAERLSVVSPFAVRFRDELTGLIVADGLEVTAYPAANPRHRTSAFTNRTGVYAVRGLPGLHDVEYPSSGGGPPPPGSRAFVVEVSDTRGRYLPFVLNVALPIEGLYQWAPGVGSPPPLESPVPLFSSPERPVVPATGVVRAELWDPVLGRPARWAHVEVLIDGTARGRGISDAHGRLLLMFAYPEPKELIASPPAGSPPGASPTRLIDRTWLVQLRAFYTPDSEPQIIPDLVKGFEQSEATLWRTVSPAVPLGPQTLRYGSELVVASESRSELWITALPSP